MQQKHVIPSLQSELKLKVKIQLEVEKNRNIFGQKTKRPFSSTPRCMVLKVKLFFLNFCSIYLMVRQMNPENSTPPQHMAERGNSFVWGGQKMQILVSQRCKSAPKI